MKLAIWQSKPRHDVGQALADLEAAARSADADLLVTTEMFVGGYNVGAARVVELAALAPDIGEIAKRTGTAIVCGMATSAQGKPYNSAVAFDAGGVEVARYHKAHLFGDLDNDQFQCGPAMPPVVDIAGWKVGLAICYDIEFPEVARHLVGQGADLIVVPTANKLPFDSVPLRLVPARAEENGLHLAYCNYTGSEGQFTYNGLSCVAGPDGHDLARAGTAEQMLYATLDRAAVQQARQAQTHLKDRRPDLYGDLT